MGGVRDLPFQTAKQILPHFGHMLVAISLGACDSTPQAPPSDPSPNAAMPTLEEVQLAIPLSDQPLNRFLSLALTVNGTITYLPDRGRDPILTTIDSTGSVIARWGRRGEGPGELLGDELLLSGDSVVAAVGVEGERVRLYSPDGTLLAERSQPPRGMPTDLGGDRIPLWQSFRLGEGPRQPATVGRRGPFVAWCVRTSCEDTLLPASDTILGQLHAAATPMLHGPWPAFGVDGERFVVGNGYTYDLWIYGEGGSAGPRRFGRALPPRMATPAEIARAESSWSKLERGGMPGPNGQRIRDNFDAERAFIRTVPHPHFQLGSIKFDGMHRMWIIGKSQDSTFLDVFADTTFLGRIMLPCRRFGRASSVRGHWLALGCEDEDEESPYVIKLFRIVEPVE